MNLGAILQLQRGVAEIFSNQHGPDKVVVVLDATAANSLQAARNVNLFKHVASLLDKVPILLPEQHICKPCPRDVFTRSSVLLLLPAVWLQLLE